MLLHMVIAAERIAPIVGGMGGILFLSGLHSPSQAKVSNGEDFLSERDSKLGKFRGAPRALLVLVLMAAGLGLVWVALVVTALSRQTY